MRYLLITLMMVACLSAKSQVAETVDDTTSNVSNDYDGKKTIKDYLKTMPEGVLPILSKNNVLDCIDFMEAGQEAKVTNRLTGKSSMTYLGKTLATFQLTSVTKADVALFAKGTDDVLIYVVTTSVTDSLPDSHVQVYASDWSLAADELQFPLMYPSRFTELILTDDSNIVSIIERESKILLEGLDEKTRKEDWNEGRLIWDSEVGRFIVEMLNK